MVTVSASRSIPGLWGRGRARIANSRSCATRAKPVGASEGSSVRVHDGYSVSLTKHSGSLG